MINQILFPFFILGLVPVGAAIILLVADTLINHRPPILILTRIDWNVLLLFFGLFVWLDGLNSTGIPHRIWFVFISKLIFR
jgi:Na+/H+ antiporter NhaD/arsenite permease-like protein